MTIPAWYHWGMNEENDLRLAKAVLAWGRTDARVAAVGWTAELERKWDAPVNEDERLAARAQEVAQVRVAVRLDRAPEEPVHAKFVQRNELPRQSLSGDTDGDVDRDRRRMVQGLSEARHRLRRQVRRRTRAREEAGGDRDLRAVRLGDVRVRAACRRLLPEECLGEVAAAFYRL